jgi:hypothetical protein
MNRWLRRRQVELDQLLTNFFHGHPFGFVGLRMALVRGIEPRTSTPAELLGSQGGDIDEQKAVGHQRSRLNWLRGPRVF